MWPPVLSQDSNQLSRSWLSGAKISVPLIHAEIEQVIFVVCLKSSLIVVYYNNSR